jgi:NADPH-dependent 2,4-dienoyl-CoA reductase/sulfur reductase-like enzyme
MNPAAATTTRSSGQSGGRRHEHPLDRVVVVGASLAGLRACETLRAEGFIGAIALVGAEAHRPYDRPPLSKKLLAGDWGADRIKLRNDESFDALGLELRLGVPAAALDTDARAVVLADGTELPYDAAIIATGSTPKWLPGTAELPTTHVLRTLDDALALRRELEREGTRLVVIGAGFIGLEVAATARRRGAEVTVLEAAAAPLVRGVGAELGRELAAFHADEGVTITTGVSVAAVDERGVELGHGTRIDADAVVIGIGVSPATAWLDGSGLVLGDGVVVAPTLAAGPPGVFVAGDIARWTNPKFGDAVRIEHWTNAAEQGSVAARNVLAAANGGELEVHDAVPFVWSDQYSHRIQFLGRSTTADGAPADWELLVGSFESRKFVAAYHDRGQLRGVLGLDLPRLLMRYRQLLDRGASLTDARALAAEQQAAS